MKTGRKIGIGVVLLLGAAVGCSPAAGPNGTSPTAESRGAIGANAIRPESIQRHIEFLAADSLGGRDTPSPGLEAAAAYLATEYRNLGLQPAGEDGTFYQRYPFLVRRIDTSRNPAGVPVEEEAFPPNIVAMLPGSDPELRNEYVILSAHLDHVGIGRPISGDSIYNGADDNATGTAGLVEVARAFTTLPKPPRRSIIFLHISGEEHGLLGSEWYSDHPTVPLEQVVANINVDMIGRNARDMIVVIGKDYSTLGDVVNRAGRTHPELRLRVSDDLWPAERFFFRSDHFNFARKRVPSIFFFAGTHEDYHRPSDQVEKIDTDKVARVSRLIFYTVEEIANDSHRPAWDRDGWAEVERLTR